MITKFKIFENLNQGEPEIGDYVICYDGDESSFTSFVNENIGIIVRTNIKVKNLKNCEGDFSISNWDYLVEFVYTTYDSLNYKIDKKTLNYEDSIVDGNCPKKPHAPFDKHEILYWSKNKEDLEIILAQRKFNV